MRKLRYLQPLLLLWLLFLALFFASTVAAIQRPASADKPLRTGSRPLRRLSQLNRPPQNSLPHLEADQANQDDANNKHIFIPIESTYYSHSRRGLPAPLSTYPLNFAANDFSTVEDHRPFAKPSNERFSFGYLANVEMGTPGQPLSLLLDFKSDKTWIHSSHNRDCTKRITGFCRSSGTYVRVASNTSRPGLLRSTLILDDASYVRVLVVADTLSFADHIKLDDFVFGMAEEGTSEYGRLGLLKPHATGPSARSSALSNFVVERGFSHLSAFSMYVNNHERSTGGLLFGAVDKSKFQGNLQSTVIVPRIRHLTDRYMVNIEGISIHRPQGSTRTAFAGPKKLLVRLEPGSAWSSLPFVVAKTITSTVTGAMWNYRYDPRLATFYVPCESRSREKYEDIIVEVEFWHGVKIPVRASQLVSLVGVYANGRPMCAMAFTAVRPSRCKYSLHVCYTELSLTVESS